MKFFRYVTLVAVALLCHAPAEAQEILWKQTNGPNAGYLDCIVQHGDFLYAGTDGMGIFRANAEGKNWTLISSPSVTAWAIGFKGDTIFAGTLLSGIIRSTDAGATWEEKNDGLPRKISDTDTNLPPIRSLLYRKGVMFAGAFNVGLQRSDNGGERWTKVQTLPAENVITLVSDGDFIWAGTNLGIFRSADDGATWSPMSNGLPPDAAYSIVKSGGVYFAGLYQRGVYRSDDGGETWREMNAGLPDLSIWAMLGRAGEVYAGTHGRGVYRAAPTDTAWTYVPGPGLVDVRAFHENNTAIYAGTFSGVFKSADGGATWAAVGLPRTVISSLAVSGQSIFAGIFAGGVSRTDDAGETWTTVNNGVMRRATIVQCLVAKGGSVLAGIYGTEGVYRTDNGGASWKAANNGLPASTVWTLAAGGADVFAGTNEGVYRTSDNGENWALAGETLETVKITALAVEGAFIVAGTPTGIFRSADGGATWTESTQGISGKNIYSLAMHRGNIFAGAIDDGGIFRSSDGGASWQPTGNFAPKFGICFAAKGTSLFAGTNKGIYLTGDGGDTWKSVSDGLIFDETADLVLHGTTLFAGTTGGGVFRAEAGTTGVAEGEAAAGGDLRVTAVSDGLRLTFNAPAAAAGTVRLTTLTGAALHTAEFSAAAGENSYDVPNLGLASGVYFLTVTSGGFRQSAPVAIVR